MNEHPRYMISVAAELVGMHPQTLRIYESKGLVNPQRTAGNTRLYSDADIERVRLIQRLTNELGLNLAGVERVLELEAELARAAERVRRLERRATELTGVVERLEGRARELRAEIVPYERGGALVRAADVERYRIAVEHRRPGAG